MRILEAPGCVDNAFSSVRIVRWIDYRRTVERVSCILLSNRIHIWNIPQSCHVLPCDLLTVNRWLTGRKSRHYADLSVYWLRLSATIVCWSWSCRPIDYAFFDTRDMPPYRQPCTRSPSYCAVIVTSTLSSSHALFYRLDRSIVYRVAYSACIVFWQIVVQHICILIIKCVPSLASKSPHTTSFMVRNVLIIAKGTIVRYNRLLLSLSTWFRNRMTVLRGRMKVHTTGIS